MSSFPLAEVFGFPTDNFSDEAERHRLKRLCPFNNKVPNCTKDKAKDPLGVCSVFEDEKVVITFPIRFRQSWSIADEAAAFFFPPSASWTSLTEVRLPDKHGRIAGNIDMVLAAYDDRERVIDFGSLEVQAVYISGNIRNVFEYFMLDPKNRHNVAWTGPNYPRPDYLSSSRKRLAPQLIYKGGILNQWNKKMAVVVDEHFFATLPNLPETHPEQANLAWLVYELVLDTGQNRYNLKLRKIVHTPFSQALMNITTTEAGLIDNFIEHLQQKLDEKLEDGIPPDAPTLMDIFKG